MCHDTIKPATYSAGWQFNCDLGHISRITIILTNSPAGVAQLPRADHRLAVFRPFLNSRSFVNAERMRISYERVATYRVLNGNDIARSNTRS